MKKTILFAAGVLLMGSSLVSCKKDYVCKCSKTYTSGNATTTYDYSVYTYKDTKARAVDRCDDNVKTGSDLGGGYTVNCEIE
jgi:hypothetical protein